MKIVINISGLTKNLEANSIGFLKVLDALGRLKKSSKNPQAIDSKINKIIQAYSLRVGNVVADVHHTAMELLRHVHDRSPAITYRVAVSWDIFLDEAQGEADAGFLQAGQGIDNELFRASAKYPTWYPEAESRGEGLLLGVHDTGPFETRFRQRSSEIENRYSVFRQGKPFSKADLARLSGFQKITIKNDVWYVYSAEARSGGGMVALSYNDAVQTLQRMAKRRKTRKLNSSVII